MWDHHSVWMQNKETEPRSKRSKDLIQRPRSNYFKWRLIWLKTLVKVKESESEVAQSCPTLCNPMDGSLPGSAIHGIFPGKNTGFGCHFLLQGIFPNQGSNPGLLHCRQMLYRLSPQGSPRVFIKRAGAKSKNTLASWCEKLTHWKRPWCWERLKSREGATKDEMVGWHH